MKNNIVFDKSKIVNTFLNVNKKYKVELNRHNKNLRVKRKADFAV